MTHKQFVEKYKNCKLCEKVQNHTKVFGKGNMSAKIAIVGEGPGKDEITELTPFVGAAGQLLDKILLAINLKREDIFFTNAILCRTDDKNRTPTKKECLNCKQRLVDELLLVNPRYTLLVGSTALKTVFGEEYKVSDTHGQWFTYLSPPCYFYFSVNHPAWILHASTRGEENIKKRTMWEDIKKFRAGIETFDDTLNWGMINSEIKRECRESPELQVLSQEREERDSGGLEGTM